MHTNPRFDLKGDLKGNLKVRAKCFLISKQVVKIISIFFVFPFFPGKSNEWPSDLDIQPKHI